MPDMTSGAITIHACPPHHVLAVLDTLAYYGFAAEVAPGDRTRLTLGEPYVGDAICCDSAIDLPHDLIGRAPEVAFTVYEAPVYSWVGASRSYVPGLGLLGADCDASGHRLVSLDLVLRLESESAEVRQARLGVPLLTAIAAMPAGAVVEPDRLATCWNRRGGEVIVVEGKQCSGDAIFAAPGDGAEIDAALAQRGFQRADDWTHTDEAAEIWRTEVYRSPTT